MVAQREERKGEDFPGGVTLTGAKITGAGYAMMFSVTSILPRVALEYGQTICAASTSFGFRCVHPFNVDVQLRFDTKTGWQRANPHFAFNKGIFWQSEFVACRNELHCACEAGGVARSEQLFRVGYFTPMPPISLGTPSLTSRTPSEDVARPSRPPVALALAV